MQNRKQPNPNSIQTCMTRQINLIFALFPFPFSKIHSSALRSGVDQSRLSMESKVFAVLTKVQRPRGVRQIRHHPEQHGVQGPDWGCVGASGLLEGHSGVFKRLGGAEELAAIRLRHDSRGSGVDSERRARRTHHVGHSQNTRVQVWWHGVRHRTIRSIANRIPIGSTFG